VVAVGGTTLLLDASNNIASETAWPGSGGGVSPYEPLPAYQQGVVAAGTTGRATPDVAYDADPATGVQIYDSYDDPQIPLTVVGGTSDAAPQWAALIAIADEGRALRGLGPLDGATQTLHMLYAMPAGVFHDITSGTNQAGSAGTGYDLVTGRGSPVANLVAASLAGTSPVFATGADAGGGPQVNVYDATSGTLKSAFFAYDPGFHGGVRVAVADVNGDGVPDIITAPGPSGGPNIRVFDGATGRMIMNFMAFDPRFTGGLYVAAGDVNGDGFADIIVGAGAGGAPLVSVFSGKDGSLLQSFTAYDPRFPGGVRVAAGDTNGDGFADIITAAGPGGGPHVKVFSGRDNSVLQSFFAYPSTFAGGVFVAAGDVNGDGHTDIVTGPGVGGGPLVRVFDGANPANVLLNFLAYDPGFLGGVRVGLADVTGRGLDILTAAGPTGGPEVKAFDSNGTADDFFAYAGAFLGGVFVGGQ
jgi:hypothetical protein